MPMPKAVDDDQEGKERVGMPLPVRFWFSVWPFAYGIQYEKVMLWYMMPWMSNINQTEPIRCSHSHISLRFPGCCSVGE